MTNFERIKEMSVEEMAFLVLDFDREYAEYILSDGTATFEMSFLRNYQKREIHNRTSRSDMRQQTA